MSNHDLIRDRLDELHVMFPSYGERGMNELDVLAKIFAREAAGWSEEKTNLVFDVLLGGKKFPDLHDVLAVGVANKTQQEIDEFEYRRLKMKQCSSTVFLNAAEEKFIADFEASNSARLDNVGERSGSGFKRLPFRGVGEE